MNMLARTEGYFSERGHWYFRSQGSVSGPFADKAEAQMAVLYFRQRLKWPSRHQLREFMDPGAPASPASSAVQSADASPTATNAGLRQSREGA